MNKLFILMSVAALSMTACNNGANTASSVETQPAKECAAPSGDLAYVNVDRILAESEIFLTEGKALQEKTQKKQESWATKEKGFQYEAAQLQEKYQKGLITTTNAQQQQASIEKRIASYQASVQKEAKSLDEENFVFTNRAQDLLGRAIKQINSGKKYKMIVNANALVEADTTLDISLQVLDIVNKLYAEEKDAPATK